jgi:transmembrane sensor
MISDIENSLLVKYLKNELNEEESQKVIGWLEQNKENQDCITSSFSF